MHKKTVVDFKELGQHLIFENPLTELSAKSVREVKDTLQEVENYQKQRYYVIGYVSYEAAKAFDEKFSVKSSPLSGEYLAYFTVHQEVKKSLSRVNLKKIFNCQNHGNQERVKAIMRELLLGLKKKLGKEIPTKLTTLCSYLVCLRKMLLLYIIT